MAGTGPVAEAAYLATKRSYIRIGRVLAAGFVVIETVASFLPSLRAPIPQAKVVTGLVLGPPIGCGLFD